MTRSSASTEASVEPAAAVAASGRRPLRTRRASYVLISVVSVIVGVGIWYVLTDATDIVRPLFFPTPGATFDVVGNLKWNLLHDMWATLWRVWAGLAVGASVGVALAVGMSASRSLTALVDPWIEILRPIPALALIPFFILWFGLGNTGKVLLIALGGFVVMVVTVHEALRHVPPLYTHAARALGATKGAVYWTVLLPAIRPAFWSGLRVSAALSFGLGIAAEFMGAQEGLGYLILLNRRTLNTEGMLVGVIGVGLLSYITDRLIREMAARTTKWAPKSN